MTKTEFRACAYDAIIIGTGQAVRRWPEGSLNSSAGPTSGTVASFPGGPCRQKDCVDDFASPPINASRI